MNLTISLNAEQTAAAESLRDTYNAQSGSSLTTEQYFETVLSGIVEGERKRRFKITADALVAGAESLPYESRLALIAQVEAQLNP